jgi:short subunit dehydrogenase-like uncharacterized protein
MADFLIYGANGYTGELIAREAVRRGMRPILAGRNAPTLAELAQEPGLEHRCFALEDAAAVMCGLQGMTAVLNCAGPFAHTAAPLASACLRAHVHYLDITGEAQVFADMAARTSEAREAGVMLMPGVGFEVVPSDCLAAHLKRRLPSATRLALGFQAGAQMSRGTALTVVESMSQEGLVRHGGVLQKVPTGWKTRLIDFGAGPVKAMTIPWGDVVTAYYSTGIGDIEVYMAVPLATRLAARLSWLLTSSFVQNWLKRRIKAGPPGPTAEQRQQGRSYLWGQVDDDAGHVAVSRLRGPEGYELTVQTALAVVNRVMDGAAPAGYQTPATAYGADFILAIEGIIREDEPGA